MLVMNHQTTTDPLRRLLTPENCALALIDHQPWVAFAVQSHDKQQMMDNVAGLAEAAQILAVPTVLSTVMAKVANDPIFPAIQAAFPEQEPIDRTVTNAWQDPAFVAAIEGTGRRKLVMAGLWTEVCLAQTVLSAIDAGYEVYFVADASGGMSAEAHEAAKQRMIQAGAVPMTWFAVLAEWTRDYSGPAFAAVTPVAKEYGGGVALALQYTEAMFGAFAGAAQR